MASDPVSRIARPPARVQRVVTVRMPRSLHETLKNEAGLLRVSVNTLCISKLMKLLDEQGQRDLTDGTATVISPGNGPAAARPADSETGADL